ncbi:cyclin-A1 [Hyla sarda]|uniref:cyclin-A1 n=1 Tax=Hyla sarda TaxID=327740 RepID=UPI0024C34C33|nr:cyclin-A1 [Hyla sarda]XP_056416320.1 cyclin-A1 [Hyla sarda]XP_056416321.1 cyclin-A1 [Hyla sarda]XP_056416322.1 cyclin-A1 [Hyla sarda]XP_056416323.1 cyclin-A1 [Hyla sarda]
MRRNSTSNVFVGNAGMGGRDGYQKSSAFSKVEALVQSNLLMPPQQMQRTVLGVISENDQRRRSLSMGAITTKAASGMENVFPLAGKIFSASAANMAVPKPCFTIYVDEAEDKQDVELPSLEESEANVLKQKFHLLLDVSAASPMMMETSIQSQPEEEASETDPDAAAVAEYIDEIHRYLREAEIKHRPKPYYMRKQPDITSAMRTILVDWLAEVQEEYKLRNETLFLAINYLDRFLSCMSVLRGKLQLVGTASILLASKYEEIYPPDIDEFVYITDDTYTKKQLLRMEHLLLKVLAFDLTVPTINQFLLQYLYKHNGGTKVEHLAMYMAELTLLQEEPFLKYLPSITAAAAYGLANYTINKAFWPEKLQVFTGYSLSDLAPCLADLHRACLKAPGQAQQAIREKFKTPKYMQASLTTLPATLPL